MYTDSTYDLTLQPAPDLIVFEGGSAVLACSPFLVPASLGLALGMKEQDLVVLSTGSRLTYQDFVVPNSPFLSNRTYTLRDVSRSDDRTRFVCVLGDRESNIVNLRVYGKHLSVIFSKEGIASCSQSVPNANFLNADT